MSAAPAGANVSQTETNPWPIIETNFLPPPPQPIFIFFHFIWKNKKIKLNIFLFNATKKRRRNVVYNHQIKISPSLKNNNYIHTQHAQHMQEPFFFFLLCFPFFSSSK